MNEDVTSQASTVPQAPHAMSPLDPLGIGVVPLPADSMPQPVAEVVEVKPPASHKGVGFFLVIMLMLGGGGYYMYANAMLGSVVEILPPALKELLPEGFLPQSSVVAISTSTAVSTSSSTSTGAAPITPHEIIPSSGVVYKKITNNDKDGFPEFRYYIFDKGTKQSSLLDMTAPSDWKGDGGTPVILYTVTPLPENKNTLTVTAYDMSTQSSQVIHVSSSTIPKSSLTFSPYSKKVGFCSDENEGSFMIEDLDSAQTTPYSSFTGCVADIVVDPPVFSKDKTSLYYKEAVGINDNGTKSSGFSYKAMDLDSDTATDTTSVVFVTSVTPSQKFVTPIIHSTKKSTAVFNNSFDVYDISKSPKSIAMNVVANSPKVASAVVDDNSHVQSYVAIDDGAGYFVYAYTSKGKGKSEDIAKLGYLDLATGFFAYPLVSLNMPAKSVSLLKAHSKESVVFSVAKASSTELYLFTVASSTLVKIDTDVGALTRNDIYFVAK